LANQYDDMTKRTAQLPGSGPAEPRVSVVRLAATGAVTAGAGPPDLVERVAYAAQLTDLIGELLGAGPFESLEVSLTSGGCVVVREPSGSLTAAASTDGAADLVAMRRRLSSPMEKP
jgi:hypothetical protein